MELCKTYSRRVNRYHEFSVSRSGKYAHGILSIDGGASCSRTSRRRTRARTTVSVVAGSEHSTYHCPGNNEDSSWQTKFNPFASGLRRVSRGYVARRRVVVRVIRGHWRATIEGIIAGHDANGRGERRGLREVGEKTKEKKERQRVGRGGREGVGSKGADCQRVPGAFFHCTATTPVANFARCSAVAHLELLHNYGKSIFITQIPPKELQPRPFRCPCTSR